MAAARSITKERAERIARGLHCSQCLEYSFKKLVVKPAEKSVREALEAIWLVQRTCGVCGISEEIGLDADGDVIYRS